MRHYRMGIIFLLAVFPFISSPVFAQGVGQIAHSEGRVDILRASGEIVLARPQENIEVGDRVRTKSYSKAEIKFLDRSLVRLAPSSCIEVTEYRLDSNKRREMGKITLTHGRLQAIVSKTGPADTFVILTPNASGKVKGSNIFAAYLLGKTSMLVKDGSLSLCNLVIPEQTLKVEAGDTAVVPFQKPPAELRPYFDAELSRYEKDVEPTNIPPQAKGQKEENPINGKAIVVSGKVLLFKTGSNKSHELKVNEAVSTGDTILTEADGKTEIRLDNGDSLYLQPDTELIITTSKYDPATGNYINSFESSKGKIKAVVDTSKKRSFQVRTPTAVCGVRGTVMLINIQPGGTTAYYEGGGGVMTSLVSGKTTLIEPGQHSLIDAKGEASLPAYTTDEQRVSLNESYGMTSLETSLSTMGVEGMKIASHDIAVAMKSGSLTAQTVTPAQLNVVFQVVLDYFKIFPLPIPRPPSQSEVEINFDGTFGYVGSVNNRAAFTGSAGSIIGGLNFNFYYPTWAGEESGVFGASFSKPQDRYLFSGDVQWAKPDNGHYKGFLRGMMRDGTAYMRSACLYIDPSGQGGTLIVDVDGAYYLEDFIIIANPTGVHVTNHGSLGILPQDFFSLPTIAREVTGRGLGEFTSGTKMACGSAGSFDSLSGKTLNITGDDWGVANFFCRGIMDSAATTDSWELTLAGERDVNDPKDGYWIVSASGEKGTGGILKGAFDGIWLKKTYPDNPGDDSVTGGSIRIGDLIGDYNTQALTWEMVGTAEWGSDGVGLTQTELGFTISELGTFVNSPVHQVYSAAVTRAAGSDAAFTAASSTFQAFDNGAAGKTIWTAVIDGTFAGSGPANPNSWTLNLGDGAGTNLSLTGDKWDATGWHATAAGSFPGGTITKGAAAGHVGSPASGDFGGIAAGTWN